MGRIRDIKKGRPSGKHRLEDDDPFFFVSYSGPADCSLLGRGLTTALVRFVRYQDSTLFLLGTISFTCISSQSWDLSFSLIAIS